jgi:hypothetical protein
MRFMRFGARRGLALVALAALMVQPVAAQSPASSGPPEESGQAVIDWNMNTLAALAAAEAPPAVAQVTLAMVHGSVYDAVNSIVGGYEPYLGTVDADPGASASAAVAAAAHGVLVELFPDQAADLQTALDTALGALPDGASKDGGVSVGEAAAAAMIAAREGDGRGVPNPITTGTEPGEYRPTPPDEGDNPTSWIAKMKPFVVDDVTAFRTAGPLALDSPEYAVEFNEVKELGAGEGSGRTEEQQAIADFWQAAIPQWNGITRSLATANELGIADAARLFAMTNLSAIDAQIACFDDKYHYMFWRPVTAIREAQSDGNDATEADPDWLPLIVTPHYPDQPSGFNSIAGANAGALRSFFGTDELEFQATARDLPPRSFTSLTQALEESISARVWQGIHFRTADVAGAVLGQQVAEEVAPHFLAVE